MLKSLVAFIEKLKRDRRVSRYDRASTKQAVVLPLLHCLGWDPFNVDEVTPEFCVGDTPVDYGLCLDSSLAILLEVKQPTDRVPTPATLVALSTRVQRTPFVQTNGLTWWVYLSVENVERDERQIVTIDLARHETQETAFQLHHLLSKDFVRSGEAARYARHVAMAQLRGPVVGKALKRAWNLKMTDPTPTVIQLLIATTETLCGLKPEWKEVHDFLTRQGSHFLFPLEPGNEASPLERRLSPPPIVGHGGKTKAGPKALQLAAKAKKKTEEGKNWLMIHHWAKRLVHDSRFEACRGPSETKELLEELAGGEYAKLPVPEIIERAGNMCFFHQVERNR